jgi:hypothetical protein
VAGCKRQQPALLRSHRFRGIDRGGAPRWHKACGATTISTAGAIAKATASYGVTPNRIACERPMDAGVPLARWSFTDSHREVLARGLVATISGTTVWRWLGTASSSPSPPSAAPGPEADVCNANVDKLNALLFTNLDYAAIGVRL